MSPWALNRLAKAISDGAVIGYPTDTIWGFGCHPMIASSVIRLLNIKNRDPSMGLILLSSSLDYCAAYSSASAEELAPVKQQQEHPVTWLVPASNECPVWIRGEHPTVAIRITQHPLIVAICDQLKAPLVSTSANRSGQPTVRNQLQMQKQFGDVLDRIVYGFNTGDSQSSEIKFLSTGTTLRARQ